MRTHVNPFHKHLTPEDLMQAESSSRIKIRYPDLLWWHTANEGKRSPFERYKFSLMGTLEGVSDFVILERNGLSNGLMIEIKCASNKCTSGQVDFLVRCAQKDFVCAVVYDDASEVLNLLDRYMNGQLMLGGIIHIKKGEESIVPIADAYDILCKKTKPQSDLAKVRKLFLGNAVKKFGSFKSIKK
jgi:hypothetical protein